MFCSNDSFDSVQHMIERLNDGFYTANNTCLNNSRLNKEKYCKKGWQSSNEMGKKVILRNLFYSRDSLNQRE